MIVHTVHGWGHHDRQHPSVRSLFVALEKLPLTITDKLIAVSPSNVEKGLVDGIGMADDYVVIRSGIELDRFGHPRPHRGETRRELGVPLNATGIGTETRLAPQEAPLDSVRAAAAVHATHPDVWFAVVQDPVQAWRRNPQEPLD